MPKKGNEVVVDAEGKEVAVPRARSAAKHTVTTGEASDGVCFRVVFADGTEHEATLPAALLAAAAQAGLAAKLKSVSGESLDEVKAGVKSFADSLAAGAWPEAAKRGRKATAAGKVDELAQAIANVKGQDASKVAEWLAGKDRGFKMKLRSSPQVAAELIKLRGEVPQQDDAAMFDGL